MKQVNAMGLACPLPVINTKNALKDMAEGEKVEVLVDNEIAVQNLTKFASVRGHGITSEKISDNEFKVVITVGTVKVDNTTDEEIICEFTPKADTVIVLSSNQMGNGDEALGKTLLKAFIFAVTKQDVLPSKIIMYNSGAFLSCEGSDSLEDLKLLESEGVEIYTCGTCLNFYNLSDKLEVGSVSNMYDIVEMLSNAGKVIRP